MVSDCLSSVDKFGRNAVERDIDGAAPGIHLGRVNSWGQSGIPFGDQFHRVLCIFGFSELLGPAHYHHALPAAAIADFFDLQTDLWVCVDVLSLHALSGEEVKFFSIVGVMHRHHVGPIIACATKMAETLAL